MTNTNLEILSESVQIAASDDLYTRSLRQWIQAKYAKVLQSADLLCKIINDPTYYPEEGQLNTCYLLDNGDAVHNSFIKLALRDEKDTVNSLQGNTYQIDDVISQVNASINSTKILCEAFSTIADSEESADLTGPFITKLSNVLNYDGSKLEEVSFYLDVINNKGLTSKQKAIALLNSQFKSGVASTYESLNDDAYWAEIMQSKAIEATGHSALAQMGLAITEFVGNIDYSSVKSAVVSASRKIVQGLSNLCNKISKGTLPFIMSAGRKLTNFLDIQRCDIKCSNDGNGCIDNAFAVCSWNRQNLGGKLHSLITDKGFSLFSSEDALVTLEQLYGKGTFVTEVPGAEISITIDDVQGGMTGKIAIRYKILDWRQILSLSSESEDSRSLAETMSLMGSLLAAETNISNIDDRIYDDYYLNGLLIAKALSWFFIDCVISGKDLSSMWRHTDGESLAFLTTLGEGLNPAITIPSFTVGGNTFHDPSNANFVDIATRVHGMSDDVYILNTTSTEADDYFTRMILYSVLVMRINTMSDSLLYIPYAYTNKMSKGSYTILSDSEHVNKFWLRTGLVASTAAIIAGMIACPKIVKNIRLTAINATLNAATLQSNVQGLLASGITPSTQTMDNLYKATKKAVRLNKLTGGFGSMTIGLSTWASCNGLADSLTGQNTYNNKLISLITG